MSLKEQCAPHSNVIHLIGSCNLRSSHLPLPLSFTNFTSQFIPSAFWMCSSPGFRKLMHLLPNASLHTVSRFHLQLESPSMLPYLTLISITWTSMRATQSQSCVKNALSLNGNECLSALILPNVLEFCMLSSFSRSCSNRQLPMSQFAYSQSY